MVYVFDTNALITLFANYYQSRFPTLWERFDQLVRSHRVTSTREVLREIEAYHGTTRLTEWATANKGVFPEPAEQEMQFVGEIFAIPHFQSLVSTERRLSGRPVADPFVIARARFVGGRVVTQEAHRPNSARIPNVCEHFGIPVCDLEGFMAFESWEF